MRSTLLPASVLVMAACTPSEEIVQVIEENSPPIAVAGNDITQTADSTVGLDGGGSYDPDQDKILYHWDFDRVPEGSTVADRENPFPDNHSQTSATEFRPDLAGIYIIKLTVEDEHGLSSDPDFVVVSIEEGTLPVADAGADSEGDEGDSFTLDGSLSYDPLGRDLSYAWSFAQVPDGSSASLSGADSASASFTADVGGVYIAALVVNNGISSSTPDTTIIRVSSANPEPPTALAGDDIEAEDCTLIDLDGSGSYDPNGDDIESLWSVQKVPEDSTVDDDNITDRTAGETQIWVDSHGDYTLTLTVTDGQEWSQPDIMAISATQRSYNTEPTVDAGSNVAADAGEAECEESGYTYDCDTCSDVTVELGGDASAEDAEGDPITYLWEVVSGDATIEDDSSLVTNVTLEDAEPTEPNECEETEYVFQVTATDCVGASSTDTVTFTATCCGVSPDTGSK